MADWNDQDVIGELFRRIGDDLGMIIDRELAFDDIEASRVQKRAAGAERVHISFKMAFQYGNEERFGCLLVPLQDAICMASYLMMVPDEEVVMNRSETEPDGMTKDAMLEVSNFVGGASDAALREVMPEGISVRSEGCQGVRADVRPAFPYEEGDTLILGRARARLHDYPEFDALLMIPPPPSA